MKKLLSLITFILLISFISCSNDEEETNNNIVTNITGVVEKGPFISGSSISVYELDDKLNGTGRVFESKTNDEGAFSISPSTSSISKYVKLSVNGFYFNEYTGRLSDAPIILEALAELDDENKNININILTHLETPRVMKLMSDGVDFKNAKKQAEKELLEGFLITNQTIIPEEASIISNNTSANILIAISSILLNERSDAQFSELMSNLREDLMDGEINPDSKIKISSSSLGLDHLNIKNNIIDRYKELGKDVEVGHFEAFIDFDGDGEIGDYITETPSQNIESESFLDSEENVKKFCMQNLTQLFSFAQELYLFDGIYTNTAQPTNLSPYHEFNLIYNHDLTEYMSLPKNLWSLAYKNINSENYLLTNSKEYDWISKYKNYARVYRAYKYLNMISLWGDVVLVTSTGISDMRYSRTPQHEILEFIIKELEEVYQHLPEDSYQYECSKYFAKAIQARAYLFKKDYSKALECLNVIINSNKYSLSTDKNTIYNGANKEAIFELPNSQDYSDKLYESIIKKGNNMVLSRYTEVLLMISETYLKLGNNQQSINYLNQVRIRNGKEPLTLSNDIELELLNEWKEDVYNEGLYFFALKRLEKAREILDIPEYKLLLPIPVSELYSNPSMTQNPGYTGN